MKILGLGLGPLCSVLWLGYKYIVPHTNFQEFFLHNENQYYKNVTRDTTFIGQVRYVTSLFKINR